MSYTRDHSEDQCDKCLKKVSKNNLKPVPFLYLDRNDKVHPNLGNDYHRYYVCKGCYKKEVKRVSHMIKNKRKIKKTQQQG